MLVRSFNEQTSISCVEFHRAGVRIFPCALSHLCANFERRW